MNTLLLALAERILRENPIARLPFRIRLMLAHLHRSETALEPCGAHGAELRKKRHVEQE
ncbi:hypothetical protein W911_03580 [Hyphomicrobium nitrativorans NL23]|uniref:Uncharacterized protein n=1 Tax=Hyphomicrobium nitrativorans NL23 TaxID=1029756 RepID=V5SHC6_9HYPH|nr:hypothetical protein [Hyphomicrobium nitrativorans]AHB49897.1 hypothetical protein W911_03580 [Hyphomicrobium nitrativorans NL23]